MSIYIWLVIFVIVLVVCNYYSSNNNIGEKIAASYHYKKKQRIMTDHEFAFYSILSDSVSDDYYIMAQAHLSAFIDHQINRQSWKGALSHIDRKSVDFLLCNKQTLTPLLAIELDDKTHEQEDRRLRDTEVERILKEAGVPLLRMASHGSLSLPELRNSINNAISTS